MPAPGKPRPLATADLDRVAQIERATFPDPWSRRSFAEAMARPEVHALALDDETGRLVGYALSVRAADEGEILNIAVDPPARAKGAGRALLGALLDHLRSTGTAQVFLEVRPSNEAAIALYRRAGFRPLGVRKGYYGSPGEDALTMVLELASPNA